MPDQEQRLSKRDAAQPRALARIAPEDWAAEEARLRETMEFIEAEVTRLRKREAPSKAALDMIVALAINTDQLLQALEEARFSPYFGRIDFRPTAKQEGL